MIPSIAYTSALLILLAACGDSAAVDAAPDANTCQTNAQCDVQSVPICGPANTCVQCTAEFADACTGTTPICGADNACTGCASGADCASGVCLADGSCAAQENVLYVAEGGTGECTRSAPCGSLGATESLLSATKNIVHVAAGNVQETASWTPSVSVQVVADEGAVLFAAGGNDLVQHTRADVVIEIRGGEWRGNGRDVFECLDNAKLTLISSRITNAGAADAGIKAGNCMLDIQASNVYDNAGIGISASGGSLDIQASNVYLNNGTGIDAQNGTASIVDSNVYNNDGDGIFANGGIVSIQASNVYDNSGTGLAINGAYDIRNNFIYSNGVTDDVTVGVALTGDAASNVFSFNTVVANRTSGINAGINCTFSSNPAALLVGNLIAGNTQGTLQPNEVSQADTNCNLTTSFIGADLAPIAFVNSTTPPFDFHLTAQTPPSVRGAAGATCPASGGVDIDGETRAQGGACDIGADERE